MTRGRIPKPKAINDLKGDTHKRRRHQTEPEPPKDRPICPAHLDEIAKQKWNEVTQQLDSMGLLSSADAGALELYCAAYGRYRQAVEMVKKYGEVVGAGANNYPMVSPWASRMDRNLDVCRKYEIEFGLTPASRSRCAIQKKGDSNGWGDFFKAVG